MVGLNFTLSVTVWAGPNVSGNTAPFTVNSAPVSLAALIIKGALPLEVIVTDCVRAAFNGASPNATVVVLIVRMGVYAFNCKTIRSDTPLRSANNVADCGVGTEEIVAVN
jgi:hypothetical protein